ncbi:glycosyltransferase family 4 protein [Chloroflexota bacterium]
MKILQTFDLLSPEYGGGVVALVNQMSKALAQKGHEVTVYTSDYKWDNKYAGSLPGVEVRPFPCWSRLAAFYFTPGMIKVTKRELGKFDVIHLNCYRNFQNIVIHHYAKKYKIPYVLEAHGATPRFVRRRGVKWLLKWLFDVTFGKGLLRDASRLIAETETEAGEYIEAGASRRKIVLIPPPFDTDQFSPLPAPRLFKDRYKIKEEHIILFLGRLNWIKGLDFLVRSFHRLCQERDDVHLVIVGPDDGYKNTLVNIIDELNLSNRILFTGFLEGDEKLSAIVDADMLVQTSLHERGARSPFEMVLCNTPIIVSRDTGAGEEVGRIDAGYLVEYGNTGDLISTIQHILDNPAEAEKKTQKAKEYIIRNLSISEGVKKYENLYKEVIEEHKE